MNKAIATLARLLVRPLRKYPGLTLFCALAGLLVSSCATHINQPDTLLSTPTTDYDIERNLVFTPPDWPQALQADLYRPRREGPAPAVLMVHGGGWERRSREDMGWIAEELAGRGFMVMNIDHRFAPQATFPAQLYDVQIAMKWLHDHAEELALDPDGILAFGFSSGAHLVSLMAVLAGSGHELDEPYGGARLRPKAVVAGGLPSDLPAFGTGKLLKQLLGGTLAEKPDVYRNASPITHVSPETPPFFLFHGAMDSLVPLEQAIAFRAELAANDVENQLYIMRLRGHITSFLTAGAVLDETASFLLRHSTSRPDRDRVKDPETGPGSAPE